ncbi:MAG: urocanate hydratase [bacterium]|nr:urocanate hydratase [bacterium]
MVIDYIPSSIPEFETGIRRAPKRNSDLSEAENKLAVRNALRYIPLEHHKELEKEFTKELEERGRIYGYRFRPSGRIKAKPIDEYRGRCTEGKAFQLMIDNNLDFEVALYPYELVTYGETGQVCQNWMQYVLIKKYLEEMTDTQTLVVESGHPLGLFHSSKRSPRVIITNALMVGMADNDENFRKFAALGCANYGQMTAGGWMYIGPQGIVHGTYNTLLNAARRLQKDKNDMKGMLFVSSGLGGMSGAQGKAAKIAGGTAIIAEVDKSRIETRFNQGWIDEVCSDCGEVFKKAEESREKGEAKSYAFHGNIVNLLEYAVNNSIHIDLLSDQTSCHEAYTGGYCPTGITFEERTRLLSEDKARFRKLVNGTLLHHYNCIKILVSKGAYFFDYGNSFMHAVFASGIKNISRNGKDEMEGFIWPSYVEDIMGPEIFDYGYGPFRWVCLSLKSEDLRKTDLAAMECIDKDRRYQDYDNWKWIRDAESNNLVVGSTARILYQDAFGRLKIALKFNDMVRKGEIGPVMMGRDHHDVSGTDSPFRETANINDGSRFMADMSTQCFAGNAARGMSLVALHNGGGVGIGNAINGGFGLVLDGSERVDEILNDAMLWDVMGGVARRAWAGNSHAIDTAAEYNERMKGKDEITLPFIKE